MANRLLRLDEYGSGGGGGSTNSFETINCPAGTDPVADGPTDTLNLTSTGGTIAITGNAATDTINFDLVGSFQPLDADLTAIAALSSTGILARTAANTWALRTITAGTGISVADGDGVSGNPTISSTITQYTDEMAQDAVGGILTDSASIDFTYNDGAPSITAVVLPGGVNHNALLNYVANQHVDHTAVTLTAGLGISGGGDISANRTFALDFSELSAESIATGDFVPFQDISDSNTPKKITFANFNAGLDHGTLAGLTDDDHTQYALLAGRSGGQNLRGGTAAGDDLTLSSTANATKGNIFLGSASTYDEVNDRLGLGTLSPTVKIHQDGGNATATYHKFTAGSTTGTTASDGFDVGITSAGVAELRQRESLSMDFYTANTAVIRIRGDNQRVVIGDVNEGVSFFTTDEQKFLVNHNNTHVPASFADVIQIMAVSSLDLTPTAATNSGYNAGGGFGFGLYACQGFTVDTKGSNAFNSGLPVIGITDPITVVGAFGQVNVSSPADVDGAMGLGCVVNHHGRGSDADVLVGGSFAVEGTDEDGLGTPTGSIGTAIGGNFSCTFAGVDVDTAAGGRFKEPSAIDAETGAGTPSITNRAAAWISGSMAIDISEVTTAASMTGIAVESSHIRFNTTHATPQVHGFHADAFSKHIWVIIPSGVTATLNNDSGTEGTAANRIFTKTGSAPYVGPAVMELIYDTVSTHWREV